MQKNKLKYNGGEKRMNWKEIAKFFSGVTACGALVHAWFGLSGTFPITLFSITITPLVNAIQLIGAVIISIGLVYYAWIKR
jgi:hypothetical protein